MAIKALFITFIAVTLGAQTASDPLTIAAQQIAIAQQNQAAQVQQIAALQAQAAALSSQLAAANAQAQLEQQLQAICPSCVDALRQAIGTPSVPLTGILICCGPATVPATQPGTSILYIVPTSTTVAKQR